MCRADGPAACTAGQGILSAFPSWSVAVGSCATVACEPSQGRKAAALNGARRVPQIAWPPLSKTGTRLSPAVPSGGRPLTERGPHMATGQPMSDDDAMQIALDEARLALDHDDVPVGAVVLVDGEIVARRHNERELSGDPTAHAEVLAMRDAAAVGGSWRLNQATLVVTLEPCPMCAGAAWASRVDRIVFGAADMKAGATGSLYNLAADPRLNHESEVTGGVRADECGVLLTDFFAQQRD